MGESKYLSMNRKLKKINFEDVNICTSKNVKLGHIFVIN